jgi:hypothetical protein
LRGGITLREDIGDDTVLAGFLGLSGYRGGGVGWLLHVGKRFLYESARAKATRKKADLWIVRRRRGRVRRTRHYVKPEGLSADFRSYWAQISESARANPNIA